MTVLMVATILFTGIILTADIYVNLDLGAIVTAFLMASLLGLGVGAMNCVLFGFFPTWKNVWSVLTRPMFIMSGIFFTYEFCAIRLSEPAVVQSAGACHRRDAHGLLRHLRGGLRLLPLRAGLGSESLPHGCLADAGAMRAS